MFVSGGVANEASFWNGTDQIDSVQLVNGGDDSYPGNRPNVAQIIPPETRTGQLALNGDLHVVDRAGGLACSRPAPRGLAGGGGG